MLRMLPHLYPLIVKERPERLARRIGKALAGSLVSS